MQNLGQCRQQLGVIADQQNLECRLIHDLYPIFLTKGSRNHSPINWISPVWQSDFSRGTPCRGR
jgi:hypothetical protein